MEFCTEVVAVTTTGVAGSATGSGTSAAMNGLLWDVYLDYHASCPVTADVTIAYADRGGNILVVSNNATDGLYHPRAKPVDNANAAITNAHDKFALHGALTVSVAQADALTACVTAYITYLRV
jgi:hypothetical protein